MQFQKHRLTALFGLALLIVFFIKNSIKLSIVSPSLASSIAPELGRHGTLYRKPAVETQLKNSVKPSSLSQNQPPKKSEAERVFCLIKQTNPSVTLSGEIRVLTRGYNLEDPGDKIWLHSSDCPKDKFSILKINSKKEIELAYDCQNVTTEQLAAESHQQWDIYNTPEQEGVFNLAINGEGQFLTYCPSEKNFFLSRDGQFYAENGFLVNSQGCILWKASSAKNQNHSPLTLQSRNQIFDDNGCLDGSTDCVAIVSYSDPSVLNFQYLDENLSFVDISSSHSNSSSYQVYSNSLEKLDDKSRGAFGMEKWDEIPMINTNVNCDFYK